MLAEAVKVALKIYSVFYKKNGRDEYGDQLANAVYLCRIVAKKPDGSGFDLFENSATDGFFQLGFGKMVLMR